MQFLSLLMRSLADQRSLAYAFTVPRKGSVFEPPETLRDAHWCTRIIKFAGVRVWTCPKMRGGATVRQTCIARSDCGGVPQIKPHRKKRQDTATLLNLPEMNVWAEPSEKQGVLLTLHIGCYVHCIFNK